jgi:hypothetical protein
MTAQSLILHYNRLNGNTVKPETLRLFHGQLQTFLDADGHGAYVQEVKNIYERVTKALKELVEPNWFERLLGAESEDVEITLKPIVLHAKKKTKAPSVPKKEKRKKFKHKSRGKKVESKKQKAKSLGELNTAKTKKKKVAQRKAVFAKLTKKKSVFIKNKKGKRTKKETLRVAKKVHEKVLHETDTAKEYLKKAKPLEAKIAKGIDPLKKVSPTEIKKYFKKKMFEDSIGKGRITVDENTKSAFLFYKPLDANITLTKRKKDKFWWNKEHQIQWSDAIVKEYLQYPLKKQNGLSKSLGNLTADNMPDKPANTFILPGVMGPLLGNLQRYKLQIILPGETHSSKTQLAMQIVNAFASFGDKVLWLDWEQGGLRSVDTQSNIKRNLDPQNRKNVTVVDEEVPRTLDAIKKMTKQFSVIAIDSGTKLKQINNAWLDELREQYPNTVWIIIMQQNSTGGTKGGSAAEFDAPVVLKTYRPDHSDHEKNYAEVFKNRGNKTGIKYLISKKQIQQPEQKKPETQILKAA